MKTERLIEILSTNLDPVDRRGLRTTLVCAVVAGAAAALVVMLGTVSPREDLGAYGSLAFVAMKLSFAVAVAAVGLLALSKSVRPGQSIRQPVLMLLLPFLALATGAIVDAMLAITALPNHMMTGTNWLMCLYCIPLFAAAPFALLIWALRSGAPTHLVQTGAISGLVAGAIGAAAYAFHCPDDALPFVAVWYTAALAFCSAVGAALGPRLLRW